MMLISVKMILMIARMMMLSILLFGSPVMVMMMMIAITIFVYKHPDNPFSNHQLVFQSILMMIQTLYDRFDQSRPSGQ